MNIATDTNAVQLEKPGPLTRAAGGLSIDTTPTDPDTDGRRQYSPNAGQAFAYRPEVAGIASGMDSTATQSPATEPAPLSGIAAPVVPGSSPPAKGIAAITQPGRNADGLITAESAQAAYGNDMQRSGGIFGTIDLANQNERMAKALGYADVKDFNKKWRERNEYGLSIDSLDSSERANYELGKGRNEAAIERLGIASRGQDIKAATAADHMASQERIADKRIDAGTRLTLPQSRINSEIDAARELVTGLSPEEIKRKTANYTATGRENPEFDPALAKAVSLANRRKYGADDHFDSREQAQQQPAGTDGDVMTRFRADRGMLGHKTGKMTEYGLEVFDASGRLIGHYK